MMVNTGTLVKYIDITAANLKQGENPFHCFHLCKDWAYGVVSRLVHGHCVSRVIILLEVEHDGDRVREMQLAMGVFALLSVFEETDVLKFNCLGAAILVGTRKCVLIGLHCKEKGTHEEDCLGSTQWCSGMGK
eukprot:10486041-Ditylum_brightwellii.AAC.1